MAGFNAKSKYVNQKEDTKYNDALDFTTTTESRLQLQELS